MQNPCRPRGVQTPIERLLDDPSARQQLAQRAKQSADALYRWDAVAEKYKELFRRLVKK